MKPKCVATRGNNRNANDTTAEPQAAPAESKSFQVYALGIMPAEARRVYSRLYYDTEEAELGYA